MKIAFRRSGSAKEVKDFGHRAHNLFEELIKLDSRYKWLRKSVDLLQKLAPDMTLRYETVGLSQEDAVSAVHASLFLCGSLSVMWNFDHLRGGRKAEFTAGSFFKNGMRNRYYCKSVVGGEAVLTYFESNRFTGSQMADIRMPSSNAPLYLEVTEPHEITDCERQLMFQLRNPGRRVEPQEIGLKITDSATGMFATAVIKKAIEK